MPHFTLNVVFSGRVYINEINGHLSILCYHIYALLSAKRLSNVIAIQKEIIILNFNLIFLIKWFCQNFYIDQKYE